MTEKKDMFNGDELATSTWFGKYAHKGEKHYDDMHSRMAVEFYKIDSIFQKTDKETPNKKLSKYGQKRADLTASSIHDLFRDFKYIVPQGSIMATLGTGKLGSLSNCFVIESPKDSYGGIMKADEELVQVMKRRGGAGIDISDLRPIGTETNNVARTSTGATSFMERFSNTTREVAQGGRRGALMITMDVRHPDILDFIKIKRDLQKVTGANISIKVTDEFMQAVEDGEDYCLRFPINKEPIRKMDMGIGTIYAHGNGYVRWVKAKEIWDEFIKSNLASAEPAVLFWDRMGTDSIDSVYKDYRPISTNPCGEIPLPAYDSCRLMLLNLFSFVEEDGTFNKVKFYEMSYEAMRLSDDLVELELDAVDRILGKIHSDPEGYEYKIREVNLWENVSEMGESGRRTGLGITALGDMLAAMDLKYGSEDSLQVVEDIMKIKMEAELDCTIDMAIQRGKFKGWDTELENNTFYKNLLINFPEQYKRMQEFGRRNISFSTIAPAGSVSLLTQTTSGMEPLFQPYYTRRKKINPSEEGSRVDFTDKSGDQWQEFTVVHPKFKQWIDKPFEIPISETLNVVDLEDFFKVSPWYGSTANDIEPESRIKMQAILQKYTTHSISSTINLPKGTSADTIDKIYRGAWKAGLKGVTVYVDGSRDGVLISPDSDSSTVGLEYKSAVKRPKVLDAEAYLVSVNKDKFNVFVGSINKRPYEIFCYPVGEKEIRGSGVITKHGKGSYEFKNNKDVERVLTDKMDDQQRALTRLISMSLRHRVNVKFLVEQLLKSDGEIMSFTKAVARVLKKYIEDGETSTVVCTKCGSSNVIFQEGCNACLDCGHSACG